MSAIAYSVHADDAIFSIGARLAALKSDIKIVSPMAGVPAEPYGYSKHMVLRREHDAACASIGAKVVNGDFLDDVYPASDPEEVKEWLSRTLLGADAVYIPFGIRHKDHLLVSNVMLDLVSFYRPSQAYFYEELPYRLESPELTADRHAHIEKTIGRLRLLGESPPNELKERAVRCYASQTDEALIAKLLVPERIWELVR